MTPDELVLEEQMLDIFVPLLKQRAETVYQHLSSMADTMDNTFSSLAHDLDETKATSGPYLDPTQNAAQMRNKLKTMCRQVYAVSARLTELSRTSNSLRGNPLDFTFVTKARQKMEAHKGLGTDDCFHHPDPRVEAAAHQQDLSGLLRSLERHVQALANTSDPLVLVFSAGLAGELVKVHSRTLNTLLQDSKKPFGRVRSTNELTHPGPGQTTSPEGQLGTQR
ncbi:uncharacterized protein ACWYII_011693 isoform 2-T2 [Salvelinus alpinus]